MKRRSSNREIQCNI
uniref:Uncharacterized protein n=1 Tax=Anguilla anguilla TaxID=7936 RepID=A0A0E9XZD7_ANGAN